MRIGVFGLGYVGLPLSAALADTGNKVYCYDIDKDKIKRLNEGIIPIFEAGLQEFVERNLKKNLFFVDEVVDVINNVDIIFICVGTPSDVDGSADLRFVLSVAETIGQHMNDYKIIVDKSTVPVGTAKRVKKKIKEQLKIREENIEFDVVSNPEFMREGVALTDILKPDRVVIGTDDEEAGLIMKELFQPFVLSGNPIIITSIESAEMIKYVSNCFLAMKISFINEMADICEKVGANIEDIRKGVGSDHRIGKHFLYSSAKFGGTCLGKDCRALLKLSEELGVKSKIVASTLEVNENRVKNLCCRVFKEKKLHTVTLWGLSFKAETDDIRESASIDFINYFLEKDVKINVHDPMAIENIYKLYMGKDNGRINFFEEPYEALNNSDFLIIVTEWKQFRNPDLDEIKKRMNSLCIFDTRNILNPSKMKEHGFEYYSIGR